MANIQGIILLLACLITLTIGQSCSGNGSMTAGSSFVVSWEVQDNGMYVDFNVSVNTPSNTWGAIGFSADQAMPNTDVVIAANDGTNDFVEDRWVGASRAAGPLYDTQQNIRDTSTDRINETLTFSFTRPICSPDDTQDIDLDMCRWLLWAWGGNVGTFPMSDGMNAQGLTRHTSRGLFAMRLCLCENFTCPAMMTPTPSVTPMSTPLVTPTSTPIASGVEMTAYVSMIIVIIASTIAMVFL